MIRLAAAAALGAASTLGFAPFALPLAVAPAPLFSLAALAWLIRGAPLRRATLIGWCYGLGAFLSGVSWVYVSMARFSGLPAAAAAAATLAFCAFLALYPALATAISAFLWRRLPARGTWRVGLAFGAAWALGEWLRGSLLTGFPWLAVGYAHSQPSPLAGYAPVLGVYGVGMLAASMSAWLALSFIASQRRRAIAGMVLIAGMGAVLTGMRWTQPVGEPLHVRLLQGDVAQDVKWDPARLRLSLDRYASLAAAPGHGAGNSAPAAATLTVLPETALPLMFDQVPRDYLALLATHGPVLLGSAVAIHDGGYVNAAVGYTQPDAPQVYAKRHLVPFGEYPPPGFRWFFDALRIPMSEFSAGPARQPVLTLAGQRIAPNICYEDLFGEELLMALPEASLLINLSNTAWFGHSLAQPQHLQIAQMRALETGRPMLRATNSGVTASVSPQGEVLTQLPPFAPGRLDVTVTGYGGHTPYTRWGNALFLVLALGTLVTAAVRGSRG